MSIDCILRYVCYFRFYCCFFVSLYEQAYIMFYQREDRKKIIQIVHKCYKNFVQKYIFDAKNLKLILRFQPLYKPFN